MTGKLVVFVGPDGAGKTTLARRLASLAPNRASYLYMGDNPRCSSALLPTTRALAALRRLRGTVHQGPPVEPAPVPSRPLPWRAVRVAGALAVLAVQIAEEAHQLLRLRHRLRQGLVVLVDRYFPFDYHAHTRPEAAGGLAPRVHGMWLRRAFPEPDLSVCLDAPEEVIATRKLEGDLASLERRRREYLELAARRRRFAVVDAARPLADVEREVAERIAELELEPPPAPA